MTISIKLQSTLDHLVQDTQSPVTGGGAFSLEESLLPLAISPDFQIEPDEIQAFAQRINEFEETRNSNVLRNHKYILGGREFELLFANDERFEIYIATRDGHSALIRGFLTYFVVLQFGMLGRYMHEVSKEMKVFE
ncbi:hypothetical protein BJX62DRAFT_203318 [Aspergillus germanicus]